MKNPQRRTSVFLQSLAALCILAIAIPAWSGTALSTAFTYQGSLMRDGQAANGSFDFEFQLFDAATGGNTVSGTWPATLAVEQGLFAEEIDFGSLPFNGDERWIEIRVRQSGGGAFDTLLPRQRLTAAPYALSAASVPPGSITGAEIAEGVVSAFNVEPSEVQLRVNGACALGSSIRDINEDGSVICEVDDVGGGGLWVTGSNGGPLSTAPVTIQTDSSASVPGLSLVETNDDSMRFEFRNAVNTDRHWTMYTRIAPVQAQDTLRFYNSGLGFMLALTGDNRIGVGTQTPVSPLTIESQGFFSPASGNGFGDFHLGNGFDGLSIGVAAGGGGVGTTRMWTRNDKPIFLGNETNGMLLGIGESGGTSIRALALAHGGPENRSMLVEPDGDLVTVAGVAPSPSSVFGRFGGDGSDGAFSGSIPSAAPQFTEMTLSQGQTISAPASEHFLYIGVQGRCTISGTIDMAGRGNNGRDVTSYSLGFWAGFDGYDAIGRERRESSDACFSAAGGAGGSVTGISPDALVRFGGNGGGASTAGGEAANGDLNGGGFSKLVDSYLQTDDGLLDVLRCPGGGGGSPGVWFGSETGSVVCSAGTEGGAGGGVVYLECGELAFTSTGVIDVSGQDGVACGTSLAPYASGGGGGGGGGVLLIRARSIVTNEGTVLRSGGAGGARVTYSDGGTSVTSEDGGNGGTGLRIIADVP